MKKVGEGAVKRERISDNVVARLPQYYHCINELYADHCVRISSSTLSSRLGFTAAQIRQDFSHFGEFGQQGYGYNVRTLRYEIREILGLNSHNTCILVGCGHLGHALLQNFDFEACGFFMLEAFDTNRALIGTQIGRTPVSGPERLEKVLATDQPAMAVLTLPNEAAFEMAEYLAEHGVKAIWNFTAVSLDMKKYGVQVEQVNMSDSLLRLSFQLNQARMYGES